MLQIGCWYTCDLCPTLTKRKSEPRLEKELARSVARDAGWKFVRDFSVCPKCSRNSSDEELLAMGTPLLPRGVY